MARKPWFPIFQGEGKRRYGEQVGYGIKGRSFIAYFY